MTALTSRRAAATRRHCCSPPTAGMLRRSSGTRTTSGRCSSPDARLLFSDANDGLLPRTDPAAVHAAIPSRRRRRRGWVQEGDHLDVDGDKNDGRQAVDSADVNAERVAAGIFHVPELRPPWLASPAGRPLVARCSGGPHPSSCAAIQKKERAWSWAKGAAPLV